MKHFLWKIILIFYNRIKLFIAAVIPDVPPEVDIQLKRQEYILGKVLDNIQDEDDDNLLDVETVRVPDYSVKSVINLYLSLDYYYFIIMMIIIIVYLSLFYIL